MKNIKGSSSYTEQSDSCDACQRCYIEIEQLRADNSNILQTVATLRDAIQQLRTEFESYRLSHPEAPVDVDVDVEDLRAQANASMPASYIANYI